MAQKLTTIEDTSHNLKYSPQVLTEEEQKQARDNIGATVGGVPIGVINSYMGTVAPLGYLLCDGSEILIKDYEKLYEVIGNLPFAQSENEGYFKLPDMRGKFAQGANENLGNNIEAGLPNITAQKSDDVYTADTTRGGWYSGAIKTYTSDWHGGRYEHTGSQGANIKSYFDFDASRCSSIYGKSTTVQPPAVTVNYIIKATD